MVCIFLQTLEFMTIMLKLISLPSGLENVDGSLSKEDALLREIIEERHVSFFADILSFNDLRRTKRDPAYFTSASSF